MRLPTQPLGQAGEAQAKKFLQNKGYHFLTQNFRTRFGEIDLIFLKDDQIVFVEVKTRSRVEQGRPEEAVTPHKIHQITRVASFFFQQNPELPQSGRIDVIAIDQGKNPPQIDHITNAGM